MMQNKKNPYADLLDLPHPVSKNHVPMQRKDRAFQFAPFSALTGHEECLKEASRMTEDKIQLDETCKEEIDRTLQLLATGQEEKPIITLTYFKKDRTKEGGEYLTITRPLKKIDWYRRALCFEDGLRVSVENILSIDVEVNVR